MRRRRLLLTFAVGLLAAPLAAEGQQARKVYRIGLFHVGLDHVPPSLQPLKEELKKLGYVEGKNISLDWRNLPDEDAARETAKEFVGQRVDLIVAFENQTARAAKAATSGIPVVFLHVDDPVASGFATNLARPGGNLTGSVTHVVSPAKQIELFKDIASQLRRLLILTDPEDPVTQRRLAELQPAAAALKIQLLEREVRGQADIERVFGSVKRGDVDGILAGSPNVQTKFTSLLIRLASEKRVPLGVHRREWVEQGGLFSYAPDFAAIGRLGARYVDSILKGAKPADLPVEQPTKFELVINLKTAKALGLKILPSVLARADELIQ